MIGPAKPHRPVILSVPHAGREYPAEMLADSAVHRSVLEMIEDRHADSLIVRAVAEGASAIVARRARAWIDLNRDESEVDPGMIAGDWPMACRSSHKVRGGLGLVVRRLSGRGELWRRPLEARKLIRRIENDHRPYHAALEKLMNRAWGGFGTAVLIDCHSMPPLPRNGERPAQLVIGDARGHGADSRFVERIEQVALRHGIRTIRNEPYAGGHTIERHGRPDEGRHAIQIEIDRSLYLDTALREVGPGLGRIQHLVAEIVSAVTEETVNSGFRFAAE